MLILYLNSVNSLVNIITWHCTLFKFISVC